MEEVEWLVVNDNQRQSYDWRRQAMASFEQIKDSLMQTHHQRQDDEPPAPQGLDLDLDAALLATLARLCHRGVEA